MRRALGSLLLLSALAATTLALAQGKRNARPRVRATPALSAAKDARAEASDVRAPSRDEPEVGDERAKGDGGGALPGAPAPLGSAAAVASSRAPAASLDGGVRSSPLNPRPEELSDAGPAMTSEELERVMSDIALLRGRVAAVGDTLFKSRIAVRVQARGDHARIAKLTVSLDDGVVYVAPPRFSAEDEATVYEHALAPGRHVLTVAVERRDDRGDVYRTAQESRFALEAPENQRLEAVIRLDDDSDMAADFPGSQKGTYDVRVRVRVGARR